MKSSLYFRYNLCRTQLFVAVFSHCLLIFFSARCLLLTLRKHYNVFTQIKVNLDIIYVEHSCEIVEVTLFTYFFSARCLLLTLMKALHCIYADERFTLL